jgi:hypothetical protein
MKNSLELMNQGFLMDPLFDLLGWGRAFLNRAASAIWI